MGVAVIKSIFVSRVFLLISAVVFALSMVVLGVLLIFRASEYILIHEYGYLIPIIVSAAVGAFLFFRWTARIPKKKTKTLARFVAAAALTACLAVIGYVLLLAAALGTDRAIICQSPDGGNRLVVLEGGFIDTVYHAYPVRFGIFYERQNDERVTRHDFWGQAEIDIEWGKNEARVYILFPQTGKNQADSIFVMFG